MRFSMPDLSIAPPNTIADRINHIVFSIPAIPLVDKRSLIAGSEVTIEIVPAIAFRLPMYAPTNLLAGSPATCCTISG